MDKVIRQGLLFSAGFDAKSEKEMKARVSEIIASASNINFDTPENKKSLQALISVFRDMFESVGNKKIDFSKMLNLPGPEMFDSFKNSANEIADVWADAVSRMGANSLRNVFMKDERSLSDALDRLTKNGKLVENRLKNIRQAFKDVRSTDINKLLSDAIDADVNFRTAETWEERTAAALRYIKVRDKILSVKHSDSFDINDVDRHQMDFFKDITDSEHRLGAYFVRDLKEVVPEMQTSLNNIFNLFRKVEIDVVPKVVKVLDMSDILGGKKSVKVEVIPDVADGADGGIDLDFKQKLEALYDAYQNAQHRLAREIEGDLLSSVPEGLRNALQGKLQSVMNKPVLKDADYKDLWGEFKPYIGTGTGIGGGSGVVEFISEEDVRLAEEAYDRLYEKLNSIRHEAIEADKELEKLQNRAQFYGFGSDKTPSQEGRIQSILSKNNRGKYVVDMLKNGYQTMQASNGEYGFDRPDLGKGVFTPITKTEYEYVQYLSQKIQELNVGWDEGLKILQSQNGQLEAAQARVEALRAEEDKVSREKEAAYEAQAKAHNLWNKQRRAGTGTGDGIGDRTQEDVENARKVAEYETNARAEAEARERAEKRRKELAEQLELYADDGSYFSVDELESQKVALQEILNTLQQENLLTDELQSRYNTINQTIQEQINLKNALNAAEKTFEQLDGMSHIREDGSEIDDPDELQKVLDKRKELMGTISELAFENDPSSIFNQGDSNAENMADAERVNASLERRIELLKQVKQGLIDIDSVDDIINETGDLSSKLEALQNIAQDWGLNIKKGQEDEARDELEEFEKIYDRITLKLANGKKVDILPDVKGLRDLYKYFDSGEAGAFNGFEIEDIEFIRKQAETQTQASNSNINAINGEIEAVDKLREKLSKILELRELLDNAGGLNYDDPTSSDPEKTIETLTRIKELYSEITGETDTPAIQAIENAISNVESLISKMQYYKDLEPSWNEDERESLRDNRDVDLRLSIKDIDEDLNAFEKYIPDQYDLQEQLEKITKTQADAEVESNQKKIQSYNELSDAVSRYVELAKSLVDTEKMTSDHQQILADMNSADTWGMHGQEEYIAKINEWQKNIGKIKSAIKAGANMYTTDDGYEEKIDESTLSDAESKLRGYIYHYIEGWDDVDGLIAGAKTKALKNIIAKEIVKFNADADIQRQQEEIAEAANAAALEEMESIEDTIKNSAPIENIDKVSDTLSDLKYRAEDVDRFTQSTETDYLASNIGIVSPHKEIENNAKAIKSYEELCSVVERYNELRKKRYVYAGGKYPTLSTDEENEYADLFGRLKTTREGVDINKLSGFDGIKDVNKLAQLLGIEVPQAAQQAKQAVGGLNNELQETGGNADNINNQVGDGVGSGAGSGQTDGATADEVQNLEAVRAKVAEITAAVEAKTTAFQNEQTIVGTVVDEEVKKLDELEEKVKSITTTIQGLLNNIKNGENNLDEALNNVVVNVNYPKSENEDKFNTDGLKTMLSDITYKVKLSNSETDKNANKIELDESILTNTLKNVFADILHKPEAPTEATKEPWARETTLGSVKDVLTQIQTNTTPIVESKTPAQPKSTLPETRLGEIKELLSQINGKISGKISGVVKSESTDKPSVSTTKKKHKEGTISHGKAEGEFASPQKMLDYYYWLEEQVTQYKDNAMYVEELNKVIKQLTPRVIDFYRDLAESGKEDPAWLAPLNEKHNLHMSKIRGGQSLAEDKKEAKDTQKAIEDLLKAYERLGKIRAERDMLPQGVERDELQKEIKREGDRLRHRSARLGVDSTRTQEAADVGAHSVQYDQLIDRVERLGKLEEKLVSLKKGTGSYKDTENEITNLNREIALIEKKVKLTQEEKIELDKIRRANADAVNQKTNQQADASASAEQQKKIQRLTALYRELGVAEAKLENSPGNIGITNNISELKQQIQLEGDLDDALREQLETTRQLAKEKKARSIAEINGRKSLKEEIADNKKSASANKVASSSRAGRDVLFASSSLNFDATENNAEVKKLTEALEHLDDVEERLAKNDWVMNKGDKEELAQATSEVNKYTEAVKLLVNSDKMFGDDNSISLNRNIGAGDIKTQLVDAAKAAHGAKFRFEEFDDELQTITGTLKVGPREFRKVTIGVNQFSGAIRESQGVLKKTETFIQSFKRKLSEISSYFSASSVIFKAVNEFKKGIQYVREIDLALTELKKVTSATEAEYDQFLKTAAKTGAKLGSTISAVTEATATFAKLGYSMKDASDMAEAAIVYKNVGDGIASTEEAADSIISTLKGFKLESSETMKIVDRFNEVGKYDCPGYIVIYSQVVA